MKATQLLLPFDTKPSLAEIVPLPADPPPLPAAAGEKAKARAILAAIRTLKAIEADARAAASRTSTYWPASAASGPWRSPSFPTRSPAATRTPAGRAWARS